MCVFKLVKLFHTSKHNPLSNLCTNLILFNLTGAERKLTPKHIHPLYLFKILLID